MRWNWPTNSSPEAIAQALNDCAGAPGERGAGVLVLSAGGRGGAVRPGGEPTGRREDPGRARRAAPGCEYGSEHVARTDRRGAIGRASCPVTPSTPTTRRGCRHEASARSGYALAVSRCDLPDTAAGGTAVRARVRSCQRLELCSDGLDPLRRDVATFNFYHRYSFVSPRNCMDLLPRDPACADPRTALGTPPLHP